MTIETKPWDSAAALRTPEEMAAYVDAVLEENDPALFAHAVGILARAAGMTRLSRDTGLSREALYRSLSADGNPSVATMMQIMRALKLRLRVEPA